MKKQLVIIGIIALFVCVGLSGCNQQLSGETSIREILVHPNRYVNKTVTIRAMYVTGKENRWFSVGSYDQQYEQTFLIFVYASQDINISMLMSNGEYLFTGIIRDGGEEPMLKYSGNSIYLEITKIETT